MQPDSRRAVHVGRAVVLRDMGSRNGTAVGKKLIMGDWTLRRGDVIRIGHSRLVFAYDLSEAFSDPTAAFSEEEEPAEATDGGSPRSDSSVLGGLRTDDDHPSSRPDAFPESVGNAKRA